MNYKCMHKFSLILAVSTFAIASTGSGFAQSKQEQAKPESAKKEEKKDNKNLVPLKIKLPKPAFKGTPRARPTGLQPGEAAQRSASRLSGSQRLPECCRRNKSHGQRYRSDHRRERVDHRWRQGSHTEGCYVEFGPGLQWVQIDLKKKYEIHAILLWHFHANAQIYHDVVVQVADDADFITNVRTIFNNDHDNSSGLGLGKDKEYWDTFEGKLIDAKGVVARYVRFYSNGSTADDQNHYTEIEVYGLPAKK